MKGLFRKVHLAVESSSGKPGLRPEPVSVSVGEEGSGRLGWGSKWSRKCPSSCLQPILLVFPIVLAPAFCCPLFPGTSRMSELSESQVWKQLPKSEKNKGCKRNTNGEQVEWFQLEWLWNMMAPKMGFAMWSDLSINSGKTALGSNPSSTT